MRVNRLTSTALAGLLAATAAGCGTDVVSGGIATASLTLHREAVTALLADGLLLDSMPGRPVAIDLATVDSLIVTVTEVGILPARFGRGLPDSLLPPRDSIIGPFGPDHPGRQRPGGPGGPGGPDGRPRQFLPLDGPHRGWIVLDVTGGGRIDLLHLPYEGATGITIASGAALPGDYNRVMLAIGSAQIWFNTDIALPTGGTLAAGVAHDAVVPSGRIMAAVDFTIPEGGGDVNLVFAAGETLTRVGLTGDGKVIVPPVLHPPRRH